MYNGFGDILDILPIGWSKIHFFGENYIQNMYDWLVYLSQKDETTDNVERFC